jgi:amino acid transporter
MTGGRVSLFEAIATSVGLVIASAVLLTATQGFAAGGGDFAAAIGIAYILMMCQATSFAEMSAIMPTSGSVYHYVTAGMGRFFGVTATISAYVMIHVFAGTAEVSAAGLFARVNFDVLAVVPEAQSWIIGVGLVLLFAIVNMIGIKAFGRIELVMTVAMWSIFVIFSVAALIQPGATDVMDVLGSSLGQSDIVGVVSLVALAMYLFVGMEYVTPLAPAVNNPSRTIPIALFAGVTITGITLFVYGIAVVKQVPNVEIADGVMILETPLAIPEFATATFGATGKFVFGIAVLLASATTINTFMASLPLILYGMAKDGVWPRIFSWVHPRFGTPWVGIIATASVSVVGSIWVAGSVDGILVLVLAAVCAWVTAYILVNIALIKLRLRRPDLQRDYRAPLFPIPQIVATLGMGAAIWFVAPPFLDRADVFVPFGYMLASAALFSLLWILLVKRAKPFEAVEPETLVASELDE